MAQGKMMINMGSYALNIYEAGAAYGTQVIGALEPRELFARIYPAGWDYAMTSQRGWGPVRGPEGSVLDRAFIGAYGFGWDSARAGNIFKVRHACRIWQGTNYLIRVYAGAQVLIDSTGGHTHTSYPQRQSIVAYRQSASSQWRKLDNLYCDTDIEIPYYSAGRRTAVYGTWG